MNAFCNSKTTAIGSVKLCLQKKVPGYEMCIINKIFLYAAIFYQVRLSNMCKVTEIRGGYS